MRKRINNRFTLLELLVAMAVFSVMMTVLMQFFGSAQKVTQRTKEKTEIYESARLALEMISRDLRTCKYVADDLGNLQMWKDGEFSDNPEAIETLSFYSKSSFLSGDNAGKKVLVTYDFNTTTNQLQYSYEDPSGLDGVTTLVPQVIAENVHGFNVIAGGGNKYLPNNVTVELAVGNSLADSNTFVKSIYIGGRGQ